ncbi:sugar transporter SWEET1-like [Chelonus insularis]|uniref:sugar transporter SWEET1-like n=1 Tax=Chelonus insularis TaxID=460826 RepID=UPI00158EE048|nr:sugar transporter SWEET1-like [Chelonus insularis]
MALEDYKEIVASAATILTMGHMLSGTIVCKEIIRKGTSKGSDPNPFVGGLGMGLLMLQYAFILRDSNMIAVNLFGLATSIAYVSVFYVYSPNKIDMSKLLAKMLAFTAIVLTYSKLEHPKLLEFRYGVVITILFFLLIASPLMNVGEVIRTQSTELLPFPLIAMGTIVSFLWLLYGIILNNGFIIFQNAVGLGLYVIQLSLFVIYPSKPVDKAAQKRESKSN